MTYLMLCEHKKTKMKLVVRATRDRINGHLQGFSRELCCVTCGCAVKQTQTKAG